MAPQTIALSDILCHRPPMIFIDEIITSAHDYLRAKIHIKPGIPFFQPDIGVPAWVGLEYMAQSIAALAGLRARAQGQPIPLGLIIGCRHYQSSVAAFAPGVIIESQVKELAADEQGLGSFDCSLNAEQTLAIARISVFGGDRHKL